MQRRGRPRATASSAVFRLLPGVVPSGLIAAGTAYGSKGETPTFARALAKAIATSSTGSSTVATVSSGAPAVGPKGVIIERAATNLCLRSQNFGNATWTKIGDPTAPTVTQDTGDLNAPDGTATAAKIAFPAVSGATSYSLVRQGIAVTAVEHTASVWLRTASGTATVWVGITGANIAMTECAVTTTWQRFTHTATLTDATRQFDIGVNRFEPYQSDKSAQTIYAWGASLEAGDHVTSYAVTAGASAARPLDSLVYTMPARCPMASGVIEFDFTPQASTVQPTYEYLIDYRDSGGSDGDGITVVRYATGVFEIQTYRNNSVTVGSSAAGQTWTAGTTYRIKATWAGGTSRLYRDGTLMATDSAGTIPLATTRKIGIGADIAGDGPTSGSFKDVKVTF